MPKISEEMFSEKYGGAGIFPDRYIFQSGQGDFGKLVTHVDEALDKLAEDIVPVINRSDKNESAYNKAKKEDVKSFLKKYFKVYFFEKDFPDNENVKESCEKSLALLEMQDSFVSQVNDFDTYLNRFFRKIPNTFLTKDAGLDVGFPSIVEISSNANEETPTHPYQRYIAIVKGDGDSMGKALEKIKDASTLSDALLEFNKKATTTISEFKGLPVYTGGDDLLFFAPIWNEKGSIFSLLQQLDDDFHKIISDRCSLDNQYHPTLSFGVSVTYYKYPMFEALGLSGNLLDKAKGYDAPKDSSGNVLKNNIVFAVQKHSGQTRSVLIHKDQSVMSAFNKFMNKYLPVDKEEDANDKSKSNKKLLSSVMHGLREKEFMLTVAVKDKTMLDNFFANNFNEPEHKAFDSFFSDVKNLLLKSYDLYNGENILESLKYSMPLSMKSGETISAEKAAIETVYNAIQFIHLVNQRNTEQDEDI